MKYRYCAVVVWYQPEDDVVENIMTYYADIEKIFVVDNSIYKNTKVLYQLKQLDKIEYIDLNGNKGLASALNIGCKKAEMESFDFILTMDQDSFFDADSVKNMIGYVEKQDIKNIGIICPSVNAIYISEENQQQLECLDDIEDEVKRENWVMTSASLMNAKAFAEVGRFDGDLFIEHIDIDMGIKLYLHNYAIYKMRDSKINQRFGNSKPCRFFWKKIHPMFANPVRTYYLVRNQIYIIKKYGIKFIKFTNVSLMKTIIKILFYEPQKKERLRMFRHGVADGFKNHMGEYQRVKL